MDSVSESDEGKTLKYEPLYLTQPRTHTHKHTHTHTHTHEQCMVSPLS